MSQAAVELKITQELATIQNARISVQFDLATGEYSGIDRSDDTYVFKNAWYRIGEGGWREPELVCKAESKGRLDDRFGNGETLRVWYLPQES